MIYSLKFLPRPQPEGEESTRQVLGLSLSSGYDLAWTEFRPADHPDNHGPAPVLVVAIYPDLHQEDSLEARVSLPVGALEAMDLQVELHESPYLKSGKDPQNSPKIPSTTRFAFPPKGGLMRHTFTGL